MKATIPKLGPGTRYVRFTEHLYCGHYCPYGSIVTGKEFIRMAKRLAHNKGLPVRVDKKRGKGSHQTLYYGTRKTIVRNPQDELKTGTFNAMLRQLGIDKSEI